MNKSVFQFVCNFCSFSDEYLLISHHVRFAVDREFENIGRVLRAGWADGATAEPGMQAQVVLGRVGKAPEGPGRPVGRA